MRVVTIRDDPTGPTMWRAVAAAPPVKPRDHIDGKYMNALEDQYLFDFIKKGGAGMQKSPLMPGWGGQVSDQEIWNLVAYIRSLAVPPYQPAKQWRRFWSGSRGPGDRRGVRAGLPRGGGIARRLSLGRRPGASPEGG